MELEHSFTVPVPEERAWEVLLDVEKVAPCMPGATLDSVDGDDITGRIKVKVGPIAMTYAGKAHFTDRDPAAHVVTLEAAGKETRGAGTASATVRSVLEGHGDQTKVTVHTTLNVTGRPAQFGRGVMAEVGGKLIGIFASNLADMLAADGSAAGGEQANPTTEAAAPRPSAASASAGAAGDEETAGSGDQAALPVEELNLTLRAYNSLRRSGIHTVGELASRTGEQLLAIDNIGPASVAEIREKLADRGLTLSDGPAAGQPHPESAASTSAAPTATGPASTGSADAGSSASMRPASTSSTAGSASSGSASTGSASTGAASTEAVGTGPDGNGQAGANGQSATPASASRPSAASTPPTSSASASWDPGASDDDDAIDLLSVAGMPILKRAVPAALVALVLVLLVALGLRRRKRAN